MMNDAYQALLPLMQKKSAFTDPKAFHAIVNVVFHDCEALDYDELHGEMWESLPYQYQLLAADIKEYITQKSLTLLDIGCGTGLATQMLLNTSLGARIDHIHLLDTSAAMLQKAAERSKNWGKKTQTIHGDINTVQGQYDLIVISSVLHHIPDLPGFFTKVAKLQRQGGMIITIHDPTQEALDSPVYRQRVHQYAADHQPQIRKKVPLIIRAINKIKRLLQPPDHITAVNKALLKRKMITEPLTEIELWSITDIHVEGLPYSANNGISKASVAKALPGYELLSYRTYAFFGTLSSNLNAAYQQKEQEMSQANDLNGRNFSSAWIKHNDNPN